MVSQIIYLSVHQQLHMAPKAHAKFTRGMGNYNLHFKCCESREQWHFEMIELINCLPGHKG